MRTIETKIYLYSELSDRAKERARDWYREGVATYFDPEYIIEDAATIAEFLGWDIRQTRKTRMDRTHHYEPTVYYSGFCSQGDGACFEGEWRADRVSASGLMFHAPADGALHRIVARIADVAKAHPDGFARVKHRGHYYHEGYAEFEFDGFADDDADEAGRRIAGDAEEELRDATRAFMQWIYRQLESEWNYQNSDEAVAENIEANEYEFDEDGDRA